MLPACQIGADTAALQITSSASSRFTRSQENQVCGRPTALDGIGSSQHLRFVEECVPTPKRWVVTFTVCERRGDRFKALWHAGQIRMIDGNIKDGRVWWFARDVEAIQGNPGPDIAGTINDQGISCRLRRDRPSLTDHTPIRYHQPATEVLTRNERQNNWCQFGLHHRSDRHS